MRMKDKVALVTGGARGIGRAICLRLADEGASVAVADILEAEAEQTSAEIRGRGGQAMAVRKHLLLVLLDHELYEYLCAVCGNSLGQKKEPLSPPSLNVS